MCICVYGRGHTVFLKPTDGGRKMKGGGQGGPVIRQTLVKSHPASFYPLSFMLCLSFKNGYIRGTGKKKRKKKNEQIKTML